MSDQIKITSREITNQEVTEASRAMREAHIKVAEKLGENMLQLAISAAATREIMTIISEARQLFCTTGTEVDNFVMAQVILTHLEAAIEAMFKSATEITGGQASGQAGN